MFCSLNLEVFLRAILISKLFCRHIFLKKLNVYFNVQCEPNLEIKHEQALEVVLKNSCPDRLSMMGRKEESCIKVLSWSL